MSRSNATRPKPRPNGDVLRLLAIADFGCETDAPIVVTLATLDDVLARWAPEVALEVPDPLRPGSRESQRCRLRFTDLASFDPAAVARALLPAAELLAARSRAAAADAAAPAAEILDELPESVRASDLGARLRSSAPASASAAGDRVGALLAQVAAPQGGDDDGSCGALAAELDRRLSRLLAAVAVEPRFVAVESAWRSLAFLLRQLGTAPDVRVEIMSARKEDFARAFFDEVFRGEYEGDSELPLGAVVVGYAFDRSPVDQEQLHHAARMGESLRVPFLAALSPGFWGLKRLPLLGSLPDLASKLKGAEYAKWNRLRDELASLWLTLVVNRFLLRDPWGEGEVDGFSWSGPASEASPLWGEGSWALAAALGRAFAADGLRLPVTATELDDLPCRPYGGGRREAYDYPLEAALEEHRLLELGECGVAALAARRGEDRGRFPLAPTFHRPRRYEQAEATRASFFAATLAHQQFAAFASHRLHRIAHELELGLSDEQLEDAFRRQLLLFLGEEETVPAPPAPPGDSTADDPAAAGEGAAAGEDGAEPRQPVHVEISTPPEMPNAREITVRLRPGYQICGGEADLVLGTTVLVA